MFSLFLPIGYFQMDSRNLTYLIILLYIYFLHWYKIIHYLTFRDHKFPHYVLCFLCYGMVSWTFLLLLRNAIEMYAHGGGGKGGT